MAEPDRVLQGQAEELDHLGEGAPSSLTRLPLPLTFLAHSHWVLRFLSADASQMTPERQGLIMFFPWGHESMVLTQRRQDGARGAAEKPGPTEVAPCRRG